ncbi:efflux RND transporter permease subunit [Candidatus Hepatobacter penaei]|uniref:efflux RND transporter permease subunit n=1 Tax=Candidatus Hepatobacter penaei TaxID=1274402 RepID=UPI0006980851|nr:efflux RND transporter permease subunit [Candidatus Hepatobacter penaei]
MKKSSLSLIQKFIDRPVLAWVAHIVIVLLGVVAYFGLPVRQFPQVEYPVLTVTTQYDGANPEVMEMQVTRPLEEVFSGLEGLDQMRSVSMAEQSRIVMRFKESRPIDAAASDVRDKLSRLETLPREATTPRITKADIDAGSVMSLALYSDKHSLEDLHDYTIRSLKSEIESVQGVAYVENYGGISYEIHIILDPVKMASVGVSPAEVSEALKQQNFNKPAGRVGDQNQEFLMITKARLSNLQDFNDLALFEKDNYVVRLSDVGYAKKNDKDTRFRVRYNGKDAVMLDVTAQSRANPIDISRNITKRIQDIKDNLPKGMVLDVAFDHSKYVESSISHVYQGIWEAVFLVLLVVFLFLHSFRIALVPLVTIPISLIGTFFIISLLGFSINVLSLLALVLAVGLVVDDAIVVLENIYRHVEDGMKPFEAARVGIKEIQFSIVGMTLTLVAVYLPIALARGFVGKLFVEFALTLASAVVISGFVALVLSPMMCARLLQEKSKTQTTQHTYLSRFYGRVNAFFHRLDLAYRGALHVCLAYRRYVFLGAIVFAGFGYLLSKTISQEVSPLEDQGVMRVVATGPFGATLSYLDHYAEKIDRLMARVPEVEKRLLVTQVGDETYEKIGLVPRHQRSDCRSLLPGIRGDLQRTISGVRTYAYCPNRSFGGNSERPFSIIIQTDRSYKDLVKVARRVRRVIASHPGVVERLVDWDVPMEGKEYQVTINRNIAAASNISLHTIAETLDILISGRRVTSFERDSRMYPVKLMVDEHNRRSPDDLQGIAVRGRKDNKEVFVPLADLVSIQELVTNPSINHYGRMRAAKIDGALQPGVGLGTLYQELYPDMKAEMPSGFRFVPAGELRRFLNEQNTVAIIFALAITFIFLVMAAQFESFRDPFIIMFSVPLALVGGVLTLWLVPGVTINIYSQVGLVTLIGLITKHGILIVDFANQRVKEGIEVTQALVEACGLRLRPILMTTSAMVLGAVPLVLGSGAGVEARRQVGWVIMGGLSIGTLLTLFVVPCMYMLFSRHSGDTLFSWAGLKQQPKLPPRDKKPASQKASPKKTP